MFHFHLPEVQGKKKRNKTKKADYALVFVNIVITM